MTRLPVITGFGGFNPAGRSSSHQGYRRLILENLPQEKRQQLFSGLATMMGYVSCTNGEYRDANGKSYTGKDIESAYASDIIDNTLIRSINPDYFDTNSIPSYKPFILSGNNRPLELEVPIKQLPNPLPNDWQITAEHDTTATIRIDQPLEVKLPTSYSLSVKSAGQLPAGFNPGDLYPSRFHPRGLQMAVAGASDAVNSLGLSWEYVCNQVAPDEIGVYASSIMSQIDEYGNGGLLQARLKGGRVSTKQLVLGFNSMPADFINAYVLGNLGVTGSMTGACASFLYNLRLGIDDIRSGRRRIVMVGTSEAPIIPEVIDGYATMGALANDIKLRKLDNSETADHQRASRPFGENCGFTIAESSQYVILMDDALAIELGADIFGAVNDVFVNADGYKKSISAPGPGNYLTFAKAVASARSILGEDAIRHHSFIQAHGSSTPQNRTTESAIFDTVARAFGIEKWPVTAVKAYLGHSLASASGDQLATTLGIFADQWLPGIKTIEKVAEDVNAERLAIATDDYFFETPAQVAFLNSKGFGGNNATASVLSPQVVDSMLKQRYGSQTMARYYDNREQTREIARQYNLAATQGDFKTIYRFGENLISDSDVNVTSDAIDVSGFKESINLELVNPYSDMV